MINFWPLGRPPLRDTESHPRRSQQREKGVRWRKHVISLPTQRDLSLVAMAYVLNFLYALLLMLVSPWLLWRRITQGRYKHGWRAKLLGWVPRPSGTGLRRIWFHAVSVGELQVLRPLIERAQQESPDLQVVVTTSTDSGYELARTLYSQHIVSFAPLDFTWAIGNALRRIQPDLLVMTELELWPNWLRMTARKGVPIAVINGRLSEKSLQGYLGVASWIVPSLREVAWIGAQNEACRDRFLRLGYPPEQIEVTGNIKFDGATSDRQHPEVVRRRELLSLNGAAPGKPPIVWLCGSTQEPEEILCLQAMAALLPRFPRLRLILVPRHAERFDAVSELVAASGLAWLRRSLLTDAPAGTSWRVLLADSVGELRWWWGLAEIGFVGGSFGSRGGQNMIEPCGYGVATSFGPNTENFHDVVQSLLESHSAVQLQDPSQLAPWVATMIERATERRELQENAIQFVQSQRGAVERTWSRLQRLIPPRP